MRLFSLQECLYTLYYPHMKRLLCLWVLTIGAAAVFSLPLHAQTITDEAQQIYQQCHKSVFQIQVIDLATGKKTSVGSGFQFSGEGHIATNFHVVSEAVHAPQRFRVEYVRHDGTTASADLLGIDVVHDLAVLMSREKAETFLNLGESHLSKGTRLFAMGNPFDLGMSVIEGIYNGLMEDSLYRKILFSGSLNPGMSGGPAFNRQGEVTGVNVATAGNEVSFLVPVEHLKDLQESVRGESSPSVADWTGRIRDQLARNQDAYMRKLLSSAWDTIDIGEAEVPGEVLNTFKCWGKSEDKENELFSYAYINCSTNDNIFLTPEFSTGQILYKYYWLTSKGLNPIRFYHLYESYFLPPNPYENAGKDDVTNFKCENNFVKVDGRDMKVLWCARNYKKYPQLYDINLSMALVDSRDRGFLVELVALGLGKRNAVEFARKFIKEIQWRKNSLLK